MMFQSSPRGSGLLCRSILLLPLALGSCHTPAAEQLPGAAAAVREPAGDVEVWRASPRGSARRIEPREDRGPELPFRAGPRQLPGH